MVSGFIDEHNGFLALNDEEYERARSVNVDIRKYHVNSLNMVNQKKVTGLETAAVMLPWQMMT